MNSFLNPHNNGPSLAGVVDVTAHSISSFQEMNHLKTSLTFSSLKVILVSLCLMM